MKDTDIMPFGKHKGTEMIYVPAHHLLWLKENISPKSYTYKTYREVFEYIEDNLQAIKREHEETHSTHTNRYTPKA